MFIPPLENRVKHGTGGIAVRGTQERYSVVFDALLLPMTVRSLKKWSRLRTVKVTKCPFQAIPWHFFNFIVFVAYLFFL